MLVFNKTQVSDSGPLGSLVELHMYFWIPGLSLGILLDLSGDKSSRIMKLNWLSSIKESFLSSGVNISD